MKLKKKERDSYLPTVGEVKRLSQKSIFVLRYNGGYLVFNYNNLALPSVLPSLLQEFEDMFQDKEIPPIRGTEHKIDVIPRTVISYKPAYRVNPTEIKEIKRQVEEFMEKGYVRESLSPCSIRDLLVPKKAVSYTHLTLPTKA